MTRIYIFMLLITMAVSGNVVVNDIDSKELNNSIDTHNQKVVVESNHRADPEPIYGVPVISYMREVEDDRDGIWYFDLFWWLRK